MIKKLKIHGKVTQIKKHSENKVENTVLVCNISKKKINLN